MDDNATRTRLPLYDDFSRDEWAELRLATPMTLDESELRELQGLGDVLSIDEVESIYLPLRRLIGLNVAASADMRQITGEFLGRGTAPVPFIVGIAGSVGVGKSTAARLLRALLAQLPHRPSVELVTTDGFLMDNATLARRGLMKRKGFPESYDVGALVQFLVRVRSGERHVPVPTYSHLTYDLMPDESRTVDAPDILILEGLNVLQNRSGGNRVLVSDFLDFSIYLDADTDDIQRWYVERFLALVGTAFQKPDSYFHKYASLTRAEAVATATGIWHEINLPNLERNIQPTRDRARLVLSKGPDHLVRTIRLRRV